MTGCLTVCVYQGPSTCQPSLNRQLYAMQWIKERLFLVVSQAPFTQPVQGSNVALFHLTVVSAWLYHLWAGGKGSNLKSM